jgi:hypothetical protein
MAGGSVRFVRSFGCLFQSSEEDRSRSRVLSSVCCALGPFQLVSTSFKCHLQKVKISIQPWSFKKRASPLFLFRAMIVEVVSNSCFAPWRAKFHSRPLLRWSGAKVEVWGRGGGFKNLGQPLSE